MHTRPVGRVPGVSFLVLHCLALALTRGRVEFSAPDIRLEIGKSRKFTGLFSLFEGKQTNLVGLNLVLPGW